MKRITIEDIRRAALSSQRTSKPIQRPVRQDLTGQDFKIGEVRYKIIGPCNDPEKQNYWVVRSTSARDSSQDLHLSQDEVNHHIAEKFATFAVHTNHRTGESRCC